MFEFIRFFRDCIYSIYNQLNSVVFDVLSVGGLDFHVSLADLLVGFICMGLIISVFWKGARV